MCTLATIEQFYQAYDKEVKDKQSEAMLQFYLDLLGMQSHAGLTIMAFALKHLPDDFESVKYYYKKDVENLLTRFSNENQQFGILPIFERR